MNKIQNKLNNIKNEGAVSLFVVIFTSLLFVTVTVGFTILMISNQKQSTNNDLAQSALDSARAGVEDGKRVLAQLADCQEMGDKAPQPKCKTISEAVSSQDCDTIKHALGQPNPDNPERMIRSSTNDNDTKLDQAYTCVKIRLKTDSYVGKTKGDDEIRLIPLRGAGEFSKVRISWLTKDDVSAWDKGGVNFDLSNPDAHYSNAGTEPRTLRLPNKNTWIHNNRGSIIRAQTIRYTPGSVDLFNIDSKSRTVFLYPANIEEFTDNTIKLKDVDAHKPINETDHSAPDDNIYNKPRKIKCDDTSSGEYMCTAYLEFDDSYDSSRDFMYLTLASVYRQTSFKIQLLDDSGNVVPFNGVQPEIDSTGRANDVLRRIVTYVESSDANQAPYPRAALGSRNTLCKAYVITDDADDFTQYFNTSNGCPDILNPRG